MNTAVHPATDPEVRRSGLGASDMPIVLGLSEWASPFELWLTKLDRLPAFQGNDLTWFGNVLEDTLAQRWADDHDRKVQRKNVTGRHPDHDWAFAHIDRKVIGQSACLEVKTTVMTEGWGDEGTDEVPPHILPQCHHQLWVEDLQVCYVTVAFLHRRTIKNYRVERDVQWDGILQEHGARFWDLVQAKQEPAIDFGHRGIADVLKKAYGITEGKIIKLDTPMQELHDMATTLDVRSKAYAKATDALKGEILHAMGTAWLAELPDGTYYRRQTTKRKGFTVEATEFTDFRHLTKAPKGV